MRREFDRSVSLGIALLALLVVVNAAISHWNTCAVRDDTSGVAHSQEVLGAAGGMRAAARDLEATQCNYVLMGDDASLASFRKSEAAAREHLARLSELTADRSDQQTRVRAIAELLRRATDQLDSTVQVRQAQGLEPARAVTAGGASRRLLDELDRAVDAVEAAEQAVLRERRFGTERAYANALLFGLASAAFGLLAVLLFVWLLRRSESARRADAAAVHEQREWFRTTLSSIGDAVIATDTAGRVTYLNAVAEALTGWTTGDAAGRPLAEVFVIIGETSRAPVDNPALRALASGTVVGLANHTLLIARDGTERPIDDSAAPIRDEAGRVTGAVLVFRDISDRKEAGVAQARLAAIVSSSEDAIISKTLDGTLLTWNAGAESLFGYTAAEAVGQHITLIVPPDRLGEEGEILQRLARGERVEHFETVRLAKGGRRVDISVSISPLFDDAGRVVGASKVARDVTAKRRAEEAVRASEARFRTTADHAPVLIWIADTTKACVWVNKPWLAFTGRTLEQEFGSGRAEGVHPDDFDRCQQIYTSHFDARTPFAMEYRLRRHDGAWRWLLDNGAPLYGAADEFTGYIGSCVDITDQKLAADALRRSEEQYRALFTSIDQGFCLIEVLFDPAGTAVDYRFLEANPVFERQTGLAAVVGRTARELVPGLEARWFETFGRVARTGEPARFVEGSDAMGRWFDVFATQVGGPQSRTVAILFTDITDRKRADEERERLLREVEVERGRLADVFQRAPSFMCVLRGPDHVFERANDRYHQLVGHRDVVGKPVREALPEIEGQGFFELLDSVYRTGAAYTGSDTVLRIQPAPGRPLEERYVDFVYEPLRDPDGAVTGILVQGVDLTDRKRAEALVREKDQRLQLFLGTATDYAVVITDGEGRVIDWAGGAESITGFTPADATGQSADVLFTAEDRAAGAPDEERQTAAREGRAEDKRWHLRKDGSEFFGDGVMVALRGGDGELRGYAKVFRDATARKRAEDSVRFLADASASLAELVDYESTLQRIANLAVGGFADWCAVDVLDAGGQRRRLAITRGESAEVTAVRSADTALEAENALSSGIPHVLRTGEPEVVFDLTEVDPQTAPQGPERIDRLRKWGIRSYLCVPLLSHGTVGGGITFLSTSTRRRFGPAELRVAQDLAERVTVAIENSRLYRSLQEQDRRKDEFLATLAHELRNPLAPVRNGMQILRLATPTGPAERTLAMMDRQLEHLVHLVDDLMDVSRVSSGKVVLRKEAVAIRELIDAAVETSRQAVEKGGHALTLHVPPEPLAADGDRTRLVQVLSNLLNNAAKYTPNGGRIDVSAEGTAAEVILRVADTGLGIPADMLPKVFDMFTQVGTSLERSQGGLGIGLTLVRRLVEMHGGTVNAESAGAGRGSTFTVRLPRAVPAAANRGGPLPDAVRSAPAAPLSVLVVDDNRDSAESLALLLELKGHTVKTAHNGPDALRTLGAFRPHLVLLDIGLPGMSGYEVARRIRESSELSGVMLVALTGWGQEEDRRRTKNAGFDHHLVKPAAPAEVETILAEVEARR